MIIIKTKTHQGDDHILTRLFVDRVLQNMFFYFQQKKKINRMTGKEKREGRKQAKIKLIFARDDIEFLHKKSHETFGEQFNQSHINLNYQIQDYFHHVDDDLMIHYYHWYRSYDILDYLYYFHLMSHDMLDMFHHKYLRINLYRR